MMNFKKIFTRTIWKCRNANKKIQITTIKCSGENIFN